MPNCNRPLFTALRAALMLSLFSACGVGKVSPPTTTIKQPDIRNTNYTLPLNDTGVTQYISGSAPPALTTATVLDTSNYFYYATDDIYVQLMPIPGAATYTRTLRQYDVATMDQVYTDCTLIAEPTKDCTDSLPNLRVYDLNGAPYNFEITLTKVANSSTSWTVTARFIKINTDLTLPPTLTAPSPATLNLSNGTKNLSNIFRFSTNTVGWDIVLDLSDSSVASTKTVSSSNPAGQKGCAQTFQNNILVPTPGCGWKTNAKYPQGDLRVSPPDIIASEPALSHTYHDQDAAFGLDRATPAKQGFKFTKLDHNQQTFTNPVTQDWDCVKDEVTGLYWEHKTDQVGHYRNATYNYAWYDANNATNGGHAGYQTTDTTCGPQFGNHCNTETYIQYANANKLCNRSDWRLPTMLELYSIIDFSLANAEARSSASYTKNQPSPALAVMVNREFFPNLQTDDYWTSQTAFAMDPENKGRNYNAEYAYVLHLDLQQVFHHKSAGIHILLVAGKPMR